MVRELNAYLGGKSYHAIAALLWGAGAVADWHPDDALRRRIASAKALMKSGYSKLPSAA